MEEEGVRGKSMGEFVRMEVSERASECVRVCVCVCVCVCMCDRIKRTIKDIIIIITENQPPLEGATMGSGALAASQGEPADSTECSCCAILC